MKSLLQKISWKTVIQIALVIFITTAPSAMALAQIQVPCLPGMNCTTRVNSATSLIEFIIRLALLLVGGIAVLFLIYGGFLYITAGGNDAQAKKGKATIFNAVIGLVVIILAWVIVSTVVGVFTNIPSTGSGTP